MFKNSYFRVALFTLLLVGAIASAGAIKTWGNETLTATDLNANFAHIHNSMVGGHGARLVDADVSTNAAINVSKVQNGRGIARAWVAVEGISACASTQTISDSMNVTSVSCAATGVYTVTLSYTATDTTFGTIATSSGPAKTVCIAASTSTTVVTVSCYTSDTGAAVDAAFTLLVLDGN